MALNSAKSSTENMIIPTTSAGIKIVTKTISNADLYKLGFGHPFGPCSLIFYSLVGSGIHWLFAPHTSSPNVIVLMAHALRESVILQYGFS